MKHPLEIIILNGISTVLKTAENYSELPALNTCTYLMYRDVLLTVNNICNLTLEVSEASQELLIMSIKSSIYCCDTIKSYCEGNLTILSEYDLDTPLVYTCAEMSGDLSERIDEVKHNLIIALESYGVFPEDREYSTIDRQTILDFVISRNNLN